MIKISPSVLACDFSRLADEISSMEHAGAEYIHLDVMDGHFVPNISFGAPVIRTLRQHTKCTLDTHLMISEPLRYLEDFAMAGSDIITFHVESNGDPAEIIAKIKSLGMKPSISVKPATPVEYVFPYLDDLDMVLIMTVEPGFGGQRFMEEMCDKILALRQEFNKRGLNLDIQVDGGIDTQTAPKAVEAGANVLVAGSALFGVSNYSKAIDELKNCTGRIGEPSLKMNI